MANFAKKMGEFTTELNKQKTSESVTRLKELLPSLVPYGVTNTAEGKISGNVSQAGSTPAKVWEAAGRLVMAIGGKELSKRFNKALEAAKESSGVRNTVRGEVTGNVLQIGDVKGDINW